MNLYEEYDKAVKDGGNIKEFVSDVFSAKSFTKEQSDALVNIIFSYVDEADSKLSDAMKKSNPLSAAGECMERELHKAKEAINGNSAEGHTVKQFWQSVVSLVWKKHSVLLEDVIKDKIPDGIKNLFDRQLEYDTDPEDEIADYLKDVTSSDIVLEYGQLGECLLEYEGKKDNPVASDIILKAIESDILSGEENIFKKLVAADLFLKELEENNDNVRKDAPFAALACAKNAFNGVNSAKSFVKIHMLKTFINSL